MFLKQLSAIALFSVALLQSNGCPANRTAQANQKITTEATPPKNTAKEAKGDQTKMDLLVQKILNKEPSAVNLAKEVGSSASPRIKPLATNEDDEVRMIALSCLGYTGGDGVAEVLIKALTDESPSASVEASRALKNYLSPAIYPQLLEVYDKIEDPARRNEVALMLGKIETAKVGDLKEKYDKEADTLAKEGLIAAMGKRGDADSKTDFLKNLQGAKDRELVRFLNYVEYINQPWATRGLAPILGNKTDLIRIGVDNMPHLGPEYLRACDVALNLMIKLTGAKLSFNVDGKTNYTDAQLQEAKQYLLTLR